MWINHLSYEMYINIRQTHNYYLFRSFNRAEILHQINYQKKNEKTMCFYFKYFFQRLLIDSSLLIVASIRCRYVAIVGSFSNVPTRRTTICVSQFPKE